MRWPLALTNEPDASITLKIKNTAFIPERHEPKDPSGPLVGQSARRALEKPTPEVYSFMDKLTMRAQYLRPTAIGVSTPWVFCSPVPGHRGQGRSQYFLLTKEPKDPLLSARRLPLPGANNYY